MRKRASSAPVTCSEMRTVGDGRRARFSTSSRTSSGSETATITDETRRLTDSRDAVAQAVGLESRS